jgi:hypothetical protein
MGDQTDQTDPTEQYDQPEHTDEQQPHPGLTQIMQDQPDHGEDSYRGSNRLTGKRAVITGADSGIGRFAVMARVGVDAMIMDETNEILRTRSDPRRTSSRPGRRWDGCLCG